MTRINNNAFIASILSLLIPGLGQIYAGRNVRGVAILIATIIVGNLNVIWLCVFVILLTVSMDSYGFTFLRIIHDIFAFYGIIFWVWQVFDAYLSVKNSGDKKIVRAS